MEETETPSPDELRRFLRGELEADEARDLQLRLAESDEALDLAEGIWAEESPLVADDGPRLNERRSDRIERRLFGRVHRTQLAEDVAGLGGGAFLHVVLGLLRAVFSLFGASDKAENSKPRREP